MDCSRINELLVDYIYQEMEPSRVEHFEAHLKRCSSCAEEVSAFESTRSMMQGLPEEDPPAHISALLLQQASVAVQPAQPSLWERLRQSMRLAVMHPAMTAAVTLVAVLGISFYVYKSSPPPGDAPRVDLPLVEGEAGTATISMGESAAERSAATDEQHDKANEAVAAKGQPQPAAAQAAVAHSGDPAQAGEVNQPAADKNWAVNEDNRQGLGTQRRGKAQPTLATRAGSAAGPAPASARAQSTSYGRLSGKAAQRPMAEPAAQVPTRMAPPRGAVAAPAKSPAPRTTLAARKPRARRAPVRMRKGPSNLYDDLDSERQLEGAKARDNRGSARQRADRVGDNKREVVKAKPVPRAPAVVAQAPQPAPRPASTQRAYKGKKQVAVQAKRPVEQKTGERSKALHYLSKGSEASSNGNCSLAMNQYNRALQLDSTLRTRVTSGIQGCAAKMNEVALLKAQKRYPRLARLLEPQVQRARRTRLARKTRARKAPPARKKAKGKKSGTSVDSFKAAPSAK